MLEILKIIPIIKQYFLYSKLHSQTEKSKTYEFLKKTNGVSLYSPQRKLCKGLTMKTGTCVNVLAVHIPRGCKFLEEGVGSNVSTKQRQCS